MTLDNQQAVIKVGQEVPFLTGSYQTTPAAR
jgi:Type II secretory pathway, component PulD